MSGTGAGGAYWASSGYGPLSKTMGPSAHGNLPKLVGKAKLAQPARPVTTGSGEHFWALNSTEVYSKACRTSRGSQLGTRGSELMATATASGFRSTACTPSLATAQQSANTLMQSIEDELDLQGLYDLPPSLERVRIFASAFGEVIDKLPSYRTLLLGIQKEYDGLLERLHAELNATAPTEARLKTMKAASLSYVGESMAWFQLEISELKQKLSDSGSEITRLKAEINEHHEKAKELEDVSDTSRFMAKESHNQNLDILKHMDRMEKQVEMLRKQEKEAQGQMNMFAQRVKEKDARIESVEKQLEAERNKVSTMVPGEEMDALREECRVLEQKLETLEASLEAKQRDYVSIVESYKKVSGQSMDEATTGEARPLTPRPTWFHCRGLLDPEYRHTVDKADQSQELLQHMLACSRTLLSAYGLALAAQKSQVFESHAKHPLTLQIPSTPAECKLLNRNYDAEDEEGGEPITYEAKCEKFAEKRAAAATHQIDEWLPVDTAEDTPPAFRHSDQVKNLGFSRWRVSAFFEQALQARQKLQEKQVLGAARSSFSEFFMENIPEEVPQDEKKLWAINMFAALRRYSAEPEFLGYLLLMKDKISEFVMRDNKHICAEVLKIFVNLFDASEGSRNITKQKFFYGLREVLPNKEKDMWQDLVTYFPAGGAELLVNFEWLLFDDLYILSPIVYALRLQHLEEAVKLSERLEKVVRGCAEEKGGTVTYGAIEEAFANDGDLSLITAQDRARAFGCNLDQVEPETKQDVARFLEHVRHTDIFHVLYFPALASEAADGVQEDG